MPEQLPQYRTMGFVGEPDGYPRWTEQRRREILGACALAVSAPAEMMEPGNKHLRVLYDLLYDAGI